MIGQTCGSDVLYWLLRSVCFMIGLGQSLGSLLVGSVLEGHSVCQLVIWSQSVGLGQLVSWSL